jgi:TonB family protein
MRRAFLILLVACGLAAAASASTPALAYAPLAVVRPGWAVKPSADSLLPYYPETARRQNIAGAAKISCQVSTTGPLHDCKVLSETPPGMGFGAAALAASVSFRMSPEMRGGQAVEGQVIIPISFTPPTPRQAGAAAPTAKGFNPDWIRKPSADELARYYPEAAQRKGVGGHARIECRLSDDGVLTDCKVLSETPPGLGFGQAALEVSSRFQMRPGSRDGRPIAGSIIVPITFASPASAPAPTIAPATLWKALVRNPFPFLLILFWLGRAIWAIFRRRGKTRATLPPNAAGPSAFVPMSPPPYGDGVRRPTATFTNDIISGGQPDRGRWGGYGFLIGAGLVLAAALFSLVLVCDPGGPLAIWLKTHL